MTHTEIQANVTKTAAFTGAGVDVSGVGTDWTIKLQVGALSSAATARFEFDDTVDSFTTTTSGPTFEFIGTVAAAYDHVKSIKKANFPGMRVGVSNAQMRLKLSELTSGASCTYHAWLET